MTHSDTETISDSSLEEWFDQEVPCDGGGDGKFTTPCPFNAAAVLQKVSGCCAHPRMKCAKCYAQWYAVCSVDIAQWGYVRCWRNHRSRTVEEFSRYEPF